MENVVADPKAFRRDVVDASHRQLVIACFAHPAASTPPPALQRLRIDRGGACTLAVVELDHGESFVRAYRDGVMVASFVGSLIDEAVRAFLDEALPRDAQRLVAESVGALEAGRLPQAEAGFQRALAANPSCPQALLDLARLRRALGHTANALTLAERIAPDAPEADEAERLVTALREEVDAEGDEATLRHRVAMDLRDLNARLQLGRLLARAGRIDQALAELDEVDRRDWTFAGGTARREAETLRRSMPRRTC